MEQQAPSFGDILKNRHLRADMAKVNTMIGAEYMTRLAIEDAYEELSDAFDQRGEELQRLTLQNQAHEVQIERLVAELAEARDALEALHGEEKLEPYRDPDAVDEDAKTTAPQDENPYESDPALMSNRH